MFVYFLSSNNSRRSLPLLSFFFESADGPYQQDFWRLMSIHDTWHCHVKTLEDTMVAQWEKPMSNCGAVGIPGIYRYTYSTMSKQRGCQKGRCQPGIINVKSTLIPPKCVPEIPENDTNQIKICVCVFQDEREIELCSEPRMEKQQHRENIKSFFCVVFVCVWYVCPLHEWLLYH